MGTDEAAWRSMMPGDVDGVVEIARLAFPDHFEDRACFAERLTLYPRGCFVLEAERIAGYLIAYPWLSGSAPPLNTTIGTLPAHADLLYLHDLALLPSVRGQGATPAILKRLIDQAEGDAWPAIALVAVNDAAGFWQRMGFDIVANPSMAAKLASYGADARYMVRKLQPRDSVARAIP